MGRVHKVQMSTPLWTYYIKYDKELLCDMTLLPGGMVSFAQRAWRLCKRDFVHLRVTKAYVMS